MSDEMRKDALDAWCKQFNETGMSLGDTRHLSRLAMKALFFGLEYHQPEIDALNAKINTLIQQNEVLRKDAERYRYIRDVNLSTGRYEDIINAITDFCGENLDTKIDVTMELDAVKKALAQIGERNDNN